MNAPDAIPADATAEELQQLAAAHPASRPGVAAHPAAYPELLAWLATLGDPAVDAALRARGGNPAPLSESPAPLKRKRGVKIGVIAGVLVLVAGIAFGAFAVFAPHYPPTAPLTHDDLRTIMRTISDGDLREQSRQSREPLAGVLEAVEPGECAVLRSFGNSMFTGDEIRESEDLDIRAGGGDGSWGWVNGRIFETVADAESFVSDLAATLPGCQRYVEDETWLAEPTSSEGVEGVVFSFRNGPEDETVTWSYWVVVQRDNVLVTADWYDEQPTSAQIAAFAERVLTVPLG